MRANCIKIYNETFELYKVSEQLGVDLELSIKNVDGFKVDKKTKTWDGIGLFAKEVFDNENLWKKLPEKLIITIDAQFIGETKEWTKEKARQSLIDCYNNLGGEQLCF